MDHTKDPRDSREAILRMVQSELSREFQGVHAPEVIEAVARDIVGEFLREEVRVKAYLPILAGRRARRRLRKVDLEPAGA
jgi:hypothetical protein